MSFQMTAFSVGFSTATTQKRIHSLFSCEKYLRLYVAVYKA